MISRPWDFRANPTTLEMKVARCFRLVQHFPDLDPSCPVGDPPVDGVTLLITQDGSADVGAHRMLPGAAVRLLGIDQGHFDLFVVQLQQGPGVHRHDIARHLLRLDDDGSLQLVFELDDGRAFLEHEQAFEPGLVDLGDADAGGVAHGTFAQELEIAPRRHGEGFQCRRFALEQKAAAQKGLQRTGVVRVDPGDERLGPHVEEGQLHAFADGAGAEVPAPLAAVSDHQDDLATRPGLDETDEAYRCVLPVIGHEESSAAVEQVRQDRHLGPVHGLLDGTGDIPRIAQVAGDALILQPIHQLQRVCPGNFRAQGNERPVHLHPIRS